MIYKLKTSKETKDIFEKIIASQSLQPFALSKIAIALSIRSELPLSSDDLSTDVEGLELNRQTIMAENEDIFKCVIESHENRHLLDEEFFPKMVKAHLDRGAKMLFEEFRYARNFYEHLYDLDKGL